MPRIILFTLSLFFLFANDLFAQEEFAHVDSTFEAYMESAWTKIENSNFTDNLQNKYASEFFTYYLKHPETETGAKAVQRAFTAWGNTGASEKADEAMPQIGYDSDIWNRIIVFVGNAYYKSKRSQDYIDLLIKLKDKLTHPKSKSAILMELAEFRHSEKETEKVQKLAREIIKLNAYDEYVIQAKGLLYEIENLSIGQKAPDFETKTILGETISLSSLEGKVVILDFWATWCGPCIPEIPHFKKIDSTYSEKDLQVIGISYDGNVERLKSFVTEKEMNWPQIIQLESWQDEIAKLYNVVIIPQTYIIGADGIIVAKGLRGEKLERKIAELINGAKK